MSLVHKEPYMNTDNYWIRRERKKKHMRLVDLAKALGISTSLCSRLERGMLPISKQMRNKLYVILGMKG